MKKIELHFLFVLIFITQKFIFAQYSNESEEYDFEHKELNVFVGFFGECKHGKNFYSTI